MRPWGGEAGGQRRNAARHGRIAVSYGTLLADYDFLDIANHVQKAPFRAAKARAGPARSKSAPAKRTPSRVRAKPAGAPTPDAPQRCKRRLCDDEDSSG